MVEVLSYRAMTCRMSGVCMRVILLAVLLGLFVTAAGECLISFWLVLAMLLQFNSIYSAIGRGLCATIQIKHKIVHNRVQV